MRNIKTSFEITATGANDSINSFIPETDDFVFKSSKRTVENHSSLRASTRNSSRLEKLPA